MGFRATVLLGGKTATGIPVPAHVVEGLHAGKRPPVRVTVGGHTYRSTVAVMGGQVLLPLRAENRAGAGVAAGDEVDVDIELDDAPREIVVPADLAAALESDEAAKRHVERLSHSNKSRHVLAIEGAMTPETRQRRIARCVSLLAEGRS